MLVHYSNHMLCKIHSVEGITFAANHHNSLSMCDTLCIRVCIGWIVILQRHNCLHQKMHVVHIVANLWLIQHGEYSLRTMLIQRYVVCDSQLLCIILLVIVRSYKLIVMIMLDYVRMSILMWFVSGVFINMFWQQSLNLHQQLSASLDHPR